MTTDPNGLHDSPAEGPASGASRVTDVVDTLRSGIRSGQWQPGHRMPPVRKLQDMLGVSTNTITAALGILEKERLVVRSNRRGIYVRDNRLGAQRLPVAIVQPPAGFLPKTGRDWAAAAIRGAMDALKAQNLPCNLVPLESDNEPGPHAGAPPTWKDLSARIEAAAPETVGVIVPWSPCDDRALRPFVERIKLPIVRIGRSSHSCRHNYVSIDHYGAGRLAASHALGRMPGPYLMISGPEPHDFPRRQFLAGFFDGLTEQRAQNFECRVAVVGGRSKEHGRHAMQEQLESSPPRCVYAVGDRLAIGAMEYCIEQGLRVPEEIAFIGTSGTQAAWECHPRLAHVQQPLEELGRAAVRLLETMVERGSPWMVGRELGFTWVEGESLHRPDRLAP